MKRGAVHHPFQVSCIGTGRDGILLTILYMLRDERKLDWARLGAGNGRFESHWTTRESGLDCSVKDTNDNCGRQMRPGLPETKRNSSAQNWPNPEQLATTRRSAFGARRRCPLLGRDHPSYYISNLLVDRTAVLMLDQHGRRK